MNIEIDNYIRLALRGWAIRHLPAKNLRAHIIHQADLSAAEPATAPHTKNCSHYNFAPLGKAFDLAGWLGFLGANPPHYRYPIRFGPPLRMLG